MKAEALAFGLGYLSGMPAVQAFALYAGMFEKHQFDVYLFICLSMLLKLNFSYES